MAETIAAPPSIATAEDFRTALVVVRNLAVAKVAAVWADVSVADLAATVRTFAVLATLVIGTNQRRAVALAALHAAHLGIGFARVDPTPFLGNPTTPAPLGAVLASSAAFVGHALDQGHDAAAALDRGLYRATRIASTEVPRAGTDALAELARERTAGWRRVTGPSPCPICAGLADGTINPWDERVSAHPHCSCVQEVVK